MSVGSVSFWQQDQTFWSRSQRASQAQAQSDALINVIGSAMTTLSSGLASIANQTALDRVNSQLTAAIQNVLQGTTGSAGSSTSAASSSSTGSSASSSSSNSAGSSAPSPAIGTGTAPLTATTSLFTLGILAGGKISVSDGTNTTTYTSTGTDTVGALINAINAPANGNANVAAWLNGSGELVITGKDATDPVNVSGTYASNIGFGIGNNTFEPVTPPPSSPSTSSSSSSSTSSSSSSSAASSPSSSSGTGSSAAASTSGSNGSSPTTLFNSAYALQTGGTAEILLASSGSSGTLLNLLA